VKSAPFDPRLESIRGLAALMVAGGHALVVYPTHDWAGRCTLVLRTFLNGDSAVGMFFVLSGLVLGMGLQRQGHGTVREFCAYGLRRAFRIYPILVLSTAVILLFILVARNYAGPHFWFSHVLDYRPSVLNTDVFPNGRVIVANFLLLSASLNLVTWTLGVEMISSLLLPLAHYARVRLPAAGAWMLLAGAVFLALLGKWFLLLGWVKMEGAFNWAMLNYFYLFYLGYLLPIIGPRLFGRLKCSRAASRMLLAVALGLLLSADRFTDTYRLGAGLGAWMVLGVLLFGFELKEYGCLEWPVVRFFGRISYSFYLLHDLVLISGARLGAHYVFHGRAPGHPLLVNLILVVLSVCLAAVLAWAAHRWIELPFIQLGKQWARRLTAPREPAEVQRPIGVSARVNLSA
jgi:peptidoglycan/LPS O-acetylase OafA/YrhL